MPEITDPNLLAMLNGTGTPAAPGVILGRPKQMTPQQIAEEARANRREARDVTKDSLATQKDIIDLKERTKKFEDGDVATAVGEERKAAAFLIRALGANDSYEGLGIGPRSLVGQGLSDVAPGVLNTLPEWLQKAGSRHKPR